MQKRGIFSLALLVLVAMPSVAAAQDYTDIGTAYELVVSDKALSQAEKNSASTVTVITRKQIESYNAETTAELVNKAIGTTFNSYGALGSLQNVQIRGIGSSKVSVYLDGAPLSTAYQGTVDLSSIPVSIIDHIEIIKSGTGNLGKANAIGGMVNIITKKGTKTEKPLTVSLENGSYLPLSYDGGKHAWRALVDSQKLDLSYVNSINGLNIAANAGGIIAQNDYTYENNGTTYLRDNAGMYNLHGGLNLSGTVAEGLEISSNNMASYQNLGVPGPLTSLTPDNYQHTLLLSTANTIRKDFNQGPLTKLTGNFDFTYNSLFYHNTKSWDGTTYITKDSTHNYSKGTLQSEQTWNLGEDYALTSGISASIDYIDSTEVGTHTRIAPSLYADGSIYLMDGTVSVHPCLNVTYLSDLSEVAPNASLGIIYNLSDETALKATVDYAENPPTFSDLYWPDSDGMKGNTDLIPEKGISGEAGLSWKNGTISYEGTGFARNMYDAINWSYNSSSSYYSPDNIDHSMYFGTEQSVKIAIIDRLELNLSYQYNKSFDLSDGQTLSDDVEVSGIRKHTAKASLQYTKDKYTASIDGEYLGKTTGYYGSTIDSVFLMNLSINVQLTDDLKTYVAVDNLLNASYQLSSGYPMPGTKIRVGGNWKY
jgi:outer membrane cobalamin receptor